MGGSIPPRLVLTLSGRIWLWGHRAGLEPPFHLQNQAGLSGKAQPWPSRESHPILARGWVLSSLCSQSTIPPAGVSVLVPWAELEKVLLTCAVGCVSPQLLRQVRQEQNFGNFGDFWEWFWLVLGQGPPELQEHVVSQGGFADP